MLPGRRVDIQGADAWPIKAPDHQLPQLLVTRTVPVQPSTICSQHSPWLTAVLQLPWYVFGQLCLASGLSAAALSSEHDACLQQLAASGMTGIQDQGLWFTELLHVDGYSSLLKSIGLADVQRRACSGQSIQCLGLLGSAGSGRALRNQ